MAEHTIDYVAEVERFEARTNLHGSYNKGDIVAALMQSEMEPFDRQFAAIRGLAVVKPTAREEYEDAIVKRLSEEAQTEGRALAQEHTALNTAVTAALEAAMVLGNEVSDLPANTSAATVIAARHLEAYQEERSETWLGRHDMGDVLRRYVGADERGDRAYVRMVESYRGELSKLPVAGDRASSAALEAQRQLAQAIAERRARRVPPSLKQAAERLEAAGATLRRNLSVMLSPSWSLPRASRRRSEAR